jgi:hypothetical protein
MTRALLAVADQSGDHHKLPVDLVSSSLDAEYTGLKYRWTNS